MAPVTLERPTADGGVTRSIPQTSRTRELISFAEYMERERESEVRHDLVEGVMEEVSGGTTEHSTICANVITQLSIALDDTDCRVLTSDQKVHIRERLGRYPDVTVACGELKVVFGEALQNPALIVEVLSESTVLKDRDDKFREYQTLESLGHYVLIDQYKPRVEHYERQENGKWLLAREYDSLEDSWQFTLSETAIMIPLSKIYRRISFPEIDPAETEEEQIHA